MKTLKIVSVLLSVLSFPSAASQSAEKPMKTEKSEYDTPEFRKALFDAARVYGRAGCGDVTLAESTARASVHSGLPANVIAAEIAVESTCDPLAVSRDGGVGLLQIMPKLWASRFNGFRDKNLLKAEDSMEVGTTILAENIQKYGLREGIRHYNGAGPDAELYVVKVMQLAGAR